MANISPTYLNRKQFLIEFKFHNFDYLYSLFIFIFSEEFFTRNEVKMHHSCNITCDITLNHGYFRLLQIHRFLDVMAVNSDSKTKPSRKTGLQVSGFFENDRDKIFPNFCGT